MSAEEKRYRKGRPGSRVLNCSLTVEEIAQIDYLIENNKWIHTRRHFFETAILELLKQQPNAPEEYLINHNKRDIEENLEIRPKTITSKIPAKELAKIDFVIENNPWVHNRSQFLETAILDLLMKEHLDAPEKYDSNKRRYRKGADYSKVIALRITEDEFNNIEEFIEQNEWISSKKHFLELAINQLLDEEVQRIESEGTLFVLKEYLNYKN